MPNYLLKDPVFTQRVSNVIDKCKLEGDFFDPHKLWDFTKTSIRSEAIQYTGECNKNHKQWIEQVNADIKSVALARDRAHKDHAAVKHYSEKLKLLQTERDNIVGTCNAKARDFHVAQKHYDSNRPTKYYY